MENVRHGLRSSFIFVYISRSGSLKAYDEMPLKLSPTCFYRHDKSRIYPGGAYPDFPKQFPATFETRSCLSNGPEENH